MESAGAMAGNVLDSDAVTEESMLHDNDEALSGWADGIEFSWLFAHVEGLSEAERKGLVDLEAEYYGAHFQEACERSEQLIDSGQASVSIAALSTRLISRIQLNQVDDAYRDYVRLCSLIHAALAQSDDRLLYTAGVLCGMRVENVAGADLFDLPDLSRGLGDIPIGLKLYYGYQQVLRALRHGLPEQALGMSYAFLTMVGPGYPGARVFLHLTAAVSNVLLSRIDAAVGHFMKAWELREQYGIVTPFVELAAPLLGLPRYCLEVDSDPNHRYIDGLVRRYRVGWKGFRAKCGLPDPTFELTEMEFFVAHLAALGWRNKEIAAYLGLSGNTIKHYLSTAYTKLGVTSRSELCELFGSTRHPFIGSEPLPLHRP